MVFRASRFFVVLSLFSMVSTSVADMMYEFRVESANSWYHSEINVTSSGQITTVNAEGVLSFGGTEQYWNGSSSGMFEYSSGAKTLSFDYSIGNSSFSMALANALFTGGIDTDGLPEGRLYGAFQATTPPKLTVSGSSISWVTSNIKYFRQDTVQGVFGEFEPESPVPGVAGLFGILAIGNARRRRSR